MNNELNTTETTSTPRTSHGGKSMIVVLFLTLAVFVGVLVSRAMPNRAQSNAWGAFDVPAAFALPSDVSQTGGLTVLTSEAGNEDLLVLLDSRNEELFVYKTDLKQGSQLLQRYPVAQLFTDARARSVGGQ
ncbi:MAG: hypothetical protein U0640_08545 [Phycisphaerales bacterium]